MGVLALFDLDYVFGRASIARHAPNPVRALPIENRVVGRPARSKWIPRFTQRLGRTTARRDFLELALLPEANPLAIR